MLLRHPFLALLLAITAASLPTAGRAADRPPPETGVACRADNAYCKLAAGSRSTARDRFGETAADARPGASAARSG